MDLIKRMLKLVLVETIKAWIREGAIFLKDRFGSHIVELIKNIFF